MSNFNLEYCIECLDAGNPFKGTKGQVYDALKQAVGNDQSLVEKFIDSYVGWKSQGYVGDEREENIRSTYAEISFALQIVAALKGDSQESEPVKTVREIIERKRSDAPKLVVEPLN